MHFVPNFKKINRNVKKCTLDILLLPVTKECVSTSTDESQMNAIHNGLVEYKGLFRIQMKQHD